MLTIQMDWTWKKIWIDIETTNSALHAKLMAKNEERLELVAVGKLRDMVHNGPQTPRQ